MKLISFLILIKSTIYIFGKPLPKFQRNKNNKKSLSENENKNLSIEDDYDKMDFITSIALDNLSLYNEKFLIDYFVKELAKLALKKQKYKALASSIFKFEDDLDEEI